MHRQEEYDKEDDWRRNTPFVNVTRRGRKENRKRWGIDGKQTLFIGAQPAIQSHTGITQAINSIYFQSENVRCSQYSKVNL